MKKKNYGVVLISILLVGAVVGWMTFNSSQDPQPAVEYRAVCRNLPANAHWNGSGEKDDGTRKEIPQTESSPNVWTPSPVGIFSEVGSDAECHFVCDDGYERKNGECKVSLIIHDPDAGTISITDGTTTYVLADRNVGATEVYSGTNCASSSCPQSVAGYIFQRGNNYGFPATGSGDTAANAGITTNSSQIAWTASHSTWITANPRYNDGSGTGFRGNSNNSQGPCSSGRHVPTTTERKSIFNALSGTAQSSFARTNLLKLPSAGRRYSSDASVGNVGNGYYRSSSPYSDGGYSAYYVYFSSSSVSPQSNMSRSYGFSVRCFKD